MKAVPLTLQEANAFVAAHHRHHSPVYRDKFRCGALDEKGILHGVGQCARPVSRVLDDGWTLEVCRLCTDGTPNVCSFLYTRLARAAKALGFRRLVTYTLDSENGASLKASGFCLDGVTKGGNWKRPGRPRKQLFPDCPKKRWVMDLSRKEDNISRKKLLKNQSALQ